MSPVPQAALAISPRAASDVVEWTEPIRVQVTVPPTLIVVIAGTPEAPVPLATSKK